MVRVDLMNELQKVRKGHISASHSVRKISREPVNIRLTNLNKRKT